MSAWPETLIREIAERRVIFFIGAGLSRTACPSLPSWPLLLNNLGRRISKKKDRDLIKKLVQSGRMLDAAQIACEEIPRADINSFLTSTFQISPTPNHQLYDDLLYMDPKTIITTNYDELIEKNFYHFSSGSISHNVCINDPSGLLQTIRSPTRSIIKIHGCITKTSTIVLDRSSYFKSKRDNPGLFSLISSLMTVNTVIFFGYSINDPDIQLILENINISTSSEHPHYALMSKFEHSAIKKAIKETYNIHVVEYKKDNHSENAEQIRVLKEKVFEFRTQHHIV